MMSMDLNARAAYIRGLMKGMEYDADSPTGKVIAAMMELLEEMAATVTGQAKALDELGEAVTDIGEDLDELFGDFYDDGDDDDTPDPGEDIYEVTCPNCGAVTTVDEETLMREELVCPQCGAAFDIELEGEEETPASLFVMPEDIKD